MSMDSRLQEKVCLHRTKVNVKEKFFYSFLNFRYYLGYVIKHPHNGHESLHTGRLTRRILNKCKKRVGYSLKIDGLRHLIRLNYAESIYIYTIYRSQVILREAIVVLQLFQIECRNLKTAWSCRLSMLRH